MKTSFAFKVVLVVLIVCFSVLIFPFVSGPREPPMHPIEIECAGISQAIKQYEISIGVLPAGGSYAVFQALLGSNRMQIQFLNPARTNVNGEALDRWGTPYQISFPGETNIVITSAGKNTRFGDSDDYIFDGRKGEFAKKPE